MLTNMRHNITCITTTTSPNNIMKIFNTLESAKKYLKQNKYRYLENYSHKEDIFEIHKKGFKLVSITPFRQNYDHIKYQVNNLR